MDVEPIVIPANPFWKVLRTFGRDEFYAGVISIVVTGCLEIIFWLRGIPPGTGTILVLAFAGPIFEKIGFFVGHFRDAFRVHQETPLDIRKPLTHYLKRAFQGGAKSLAQDVLVHDPIYAGLMLGGMHFHGGTPAFVLVPIAFGIAVILVAALEVGVHEVRYRLFQKKLTSLGFVRESYLESRLYLEPNFDPQHVITKLRDKFFQGIPIRTLEYQDNYCLGCEELPEFNSRSGKLRLRNRGHLDKPDEWVNTIQLIYTRAVEDSDDLSQFRCFPLRKDKFYKMMSGMTQGSDTDEALKIALGPLPNNSWIKHLHCPHQDHSHPLYSIDFTRQVVHNNELLISVDSVKGFHLVEIKAYPPHAQRLKEAMRYVMHHFPVMQMTHGKSELARMLKFDEVVA
jgi:hypothetical protein